MKSALILQAEINRLQRALEEWEDPIPNLEPKPGIWQTRDGTIVSVSDDWHCQIIRSETDHPLPYQYFIDSRGAYYHAKHINLKGLDLVKPIYLLE